MTSFFRHGSSKRDASDQLLRLVPVIQDKKASGIHSCILFLDIKKAFDRVDTRTLICDLHSHGLPLYQDHVAEGYSPEEGTPQGGILSPLPWNFYFRKVAEAAEKCFSKPSFFGFAYDSAIVVHGTSQQDVFLQAYSSLSACPSMGIALSSSMF